MSRTAFILALALLGLCALPLDAKDASDPMCDLHFMPACEAVPAGSFVPRYAPPSSFDLKAAVSAKTVNLITEALLKKASQKPSKTGKKLEDFALSMEQEGHLCLRGVFVWPKDEKTKSARFHFSVLARVSTFENNAVCADILSATVFMRPEAKVKVYGDDGKAKSVDCAQEIFRSSPDDPKPVALMLDFLAPGVTEVTTERILAMQKSLQASLEKKYAGVRASAPQEQLSDVIHIDGNRVILRVLPTLFNPLMPETEVTYVAVHQGKLVLFANFKEKGN